MKIAIRVTTYVAMLAAAVLLAGSQGQPLPFPIPPTQMSQAAQQGQPLPFPIPPGGMGRV